MTFVDTYVFREDFFSVGLEQETGIPYLSIPVSAGITDYEEYYRLDRDMFDRAPGNVDELRAFAQKCRLRQMDDRLVIKPGRNRGTAV